MKPLPSEDLQYVDRVNALHWPKLAGQTVFVTGGTGFVGRWLVESILFANDSRGLGLKLLVLTRDGHRFRRTAPHVASHPAVEVIESSVRALPSLSLRCRYFIHAATESGLSPSVDSPLGVFEADVEGTRRLLEFARIQGVERFLFTSSGAVYGTQPPDLLHVGEDYAGAPSCLDLRLGYGNAKRTSEFMIAAYAQALGFDALIARLFAFVGPLLPLDLNFAVGNFMRDAMAGGPVRISGDGTAFRSYLYAADMAAWLLAILFSGQSLRPYNVGSGTEVSIAQLAEQVVSVIDDGVSIEIAGTPDPGRRPARYVPSVARAESELGLRQNYTLAEGIARTRDWYLGAATS